MQWDDVPTVDSSSRQIAPSSHVLTYYLRTNSTAEAATVIGVGSGNTWRFTIDSAVTEGFDAGDWYFQAVATGITSGVKTTIGNGSLTVLPSLAYSGTATAFDGRSQAERDLDAVNGAIRSLMTGGAVREYQIGERRISRYSLSELLVLQSRLKAEVAREKKAEKIANGLGNPHAVYVRFGQKVGYPVRSTYRW